MLASGKADAFATDDVLLYGFIATAKNASDMKVVGEYLSYDPYGLVYRRDDPAFAAVVERTFTRSETARARDYLIATATPGYTMRRQGPERAIERRANSQGRETSRPAGHAANQV